MHQDEATSAKIVARHLSPFPSFNASSRTATLDTDTSRTPANSTRDPKHESHFAPRRAVEAFSYYLKLHRGRVSRRELHRPNRQFGGYCEQRYCGGELGWELYPTIRVRNVRNESMPPRWQLRDAGFFD